MSITSADTALLRLMQLSSVSLPVGGYAFSQGLEYAIEEDWLSNEEQVQQWLATQITQGLAQLDLPILRLAMQALTRCDENALPTLNQLILANRESSELRLSDSAMGEALTRVLRQQQIPVIFQKKTEVSFVLMFAIAAHHWKIEYHHAALGFSWSWLENQVAAATKLVPLGQSQAQRLLGNLQALLIDAVTDAETIEAEQIGAALPALAIASALHETQYTRIFRS
ncbi:MAG: urease accessory protein UreF [Oceanospirillaceae bacterium]|nr:urease accessory protein UreF [Oceanospirillaceae bacterium]